MKKKSTNTEKITNQVIRSGVMQCVCAGMFISTLSYAKICKILSNCVSVIADDTDEENQNLKDSFTSVFLTRESENYSEPQRNSFNILSKLRRVDCSSSGDSVRLVLHNGYLDLADQAHNDFIAQASHYEQLDVLQHSRHTSFLLQPVFAKEQDDLIVSTTLQVYSDSSFVITTSVNIENMPASLLSENILNFPIIDPLVPLCTSVEHPKVWGYYDSTNVLTLNQIQHLWIEVLSNTLNCSTMTNSQSHVILYIFDSDCLPHDFENANPNRDYSRMIYQLLFAPVLSSNYPSEAAETSRLYEGNFILSSHSSIYSSTVPRTIVAVGKSRDGIIKQALAESDNLSSLSPKEAAKEIEHIYRCNAIDAVLPAIQIIARSQFYLEYIVHSCSETKFKTTKSLVKMREMIHFATIEYTRSSIVRYDTLRELIEFIMGRQKNRITPEQCSKIVDQFDSAVQFRASVATAKNEKYLSSVITLLTFIVSFSSIASGVEYMDEALHIFPIELQSKYIFWVALLIIGIFTVSAIVVYGIKKIVSLITQNQI